MREGDEAEEGIGERNTKREGDMRTEMAERGYMDRAREITGRGWGKGEKKHRERESDRSIQRSG